MRVEPLVKVIFRHHLIEAERNLLVTYDSAIEAAGLPVEAWPDFIRVREYGGLPVSFAKPTHASERADHIDYTSGSLTLRVRRG